MKKAMILTLLPLLFFLLHQPDISAESSKVIDGTFTVSGYNNPTIINQEDILIYDINGSNQFADATLTTSLTPYQEYLLRFNIQDLDGMKDLELEISLVHYEESTATTPLSYITTKTEVLTETAPDILKIRWTPTFTGDELTSESFTLIKEVETISTWEVNPVIEINESPVTLTSNSVENSELSRSFNVYFKTSKVANYSLDGEWNVHIKTIDKINITPEYSYIHKNGYSMMYYGEVRTTNAVNPEWVNVFPKMNYDDQAAQATAQNVEFLSNAAYDIIVQSSEVWTQKSGHVKGDAKITDDASINNTFSIVASLDDVWDSNMVNSGRLDHKVGKAIASGRAKTGEAYDELDIYLYLKLSPQFQNGSYSGSLSFGIRNTV